MTRLSRRRAGGLVLRGALFVAAGPTTLPLGLAHAAVGPRQLSLAWYARTAGDVEGRPAVAADGSVYVAGTDGTIYGLAADGGLRWSIGAGAAVTGSVALGPEGRLYVGDARGRFRAIHSGDGSILWTLDGFASISSDPVVHDGRVYFGTDAGDLIALEPDGRERFRLRAEAGITGPAAFGPEGDVLYTSHDGKLRRATAGGDGIWTAALDGPIVGGAALSPDGATVYVGAGQSLVAVARDSGAVRWRFGMGADVLATPAVAPDGMVYIGADNGRFVAVSPAGPAVWQAQAGGGIRSSAAVSDEGSVYFGAGDAIVYAYDSQGNRLSTYRALDSVHGDAVLGADGTVFVGSRDNRLSAFRESARRFSESPADRLGGDLVRDPGSGRVYVIVAGRRRHIPDPATQLLLGLAGPLPMTLTATEANRYPEGPALPALREGSLVRAANGPLYVIRSGRRVWVSSLAAFQAAGYRWEDVLDLEDVVIRSIALQTEDGMLLKGGGERVYVLEGGQRRWVSTAAAFATRGFAWSNVHFVSDSLLGAIPEGASI